MSVKAEEITVDPVPQEVMEEAIPAELPQDPAPVEQTEQQSDTTISADGVYVLKQGVSEDLDISTSTSNSYWTQVDTSAEITFTDDGSLVVVKDDQHTAADITVNEEEFIKALNQAVTGDVNDDTYTWEYNKVILEDNGYHLDCIAYVPEYIVTYVTGDNNDIKVAVLRNDTTSGVDYSRDGYELVGYYTDEEFLNSYDFDTKVKESFNIYLSWAQITADDELPPARPVVDSTPTSTEASNQTPPTTNSTSQTQETPATTSEPAVVTTVEVESEAAPAEESIVLGAIREVEETPAEAVVEPAVTGRGAIMTGDVEKLFIYGFLAAWSALLLFVYCYYYFIKRV